MLSLINADLVSKGLPTLGFLNPLLYSNKTVATAFRDVVEGDNRCGALGSPCCGGYDAGEGWDAVTGLGVPNWKKLAEAISMFSQGRDTAGGTLSENETVREENVTEE